MTILTLSTLHLYYGLSLTEAWKNKVVDCLSECQKDSGGEWVTEIPGLLFALNAFKSRKNIEDLQTLIESFSAMYLETVKERIDLAGASYLMFAWAKTHTVNESLCEYLFQTCIDKELAGTFYERLQVIELINMVQNYSELGVRNDTFFSILLKYTIEKLDKLSMPWVTILLDSIARSAVDTQVVVDYFVKIAPILHKKFQKSY